MKFLIVDDEFNSRFLLQRILAPYGNSDMVVNGKEALDAFILAHAQGKPYTLITMDIMMPELDGHQTVQEIRSRETALGIQPRHEAKVLMVTSINSQRSVIDAFFQDGCTDYIVKPVTKESVETKLREFGLIPYEEQGGLK